MGTDKPLKNGLTRALAAERSLETLSRFFAFVNVWFVHIFFFMYHVRYMDSKKFRSSSSGKMRLPSAVLMIPKMKPSLSVDEKDLPELKDWKVGESYELSVTAKLVSLNGEGDKMTGRFEVSKVESDEEEDEDEADSSDDESKE
jgi:hypothetical protein